MIERQILESHAHRLLDDDELLFQRLLTPVMHRPAGTPRSIPDLQAHGFAVVPTANMTAPVPQEELTRLFGSKQDGTPRITSATLEEILMTTKTLADGLTAFPLVACESLGEEKTRVRIVRASDVARWVPSLTAVAGLTAADIRTKAEYEAL